MMQSAMAIPKGIFEKVFDGHLTEFLYWLEYTVVFAFVLDIMDWSTSRGASAGDLKKMAIFLPIANALNPIVVFGHLRYGRGKRPYWWCFCYFPCLAALMLVMSTSMPPCSQLPDFFRAKYGVGEGESSLLCPMPPQQQQQPFGPSLPLTFDRVNSGKPGVNFVNLTSPMCYLDAAQARRRFVVTRWEKQGASLASPLTENPVRLAVSLGIRSHDGAGLPDLSSVYGTGYRINTFDTAPIYCMCQDSVLRESLQGKSSDAGGGEGAASATAETAAPPQQRQSQGAGGLLPAEEPFNFTNAGFVHYDTGLVGMAHVSEEEVQLLQDALLWQVDWHAGLVSRPGETPDSLASNVTESIQATRARYTNTSRAVEDILLNFSGRDYAYLAGGYPLPGGSLDSPPTGWVIRSSGDADKALRNRLETRGAELVSRTPSGDGYFAKSLVWQVQKYGASRPFFERSHRHFMGMAAHGAAAAAAGGTLQPLTPSEADSLISGNLTAFPNAILYDWDLLGWRTYFDQKTFIDTVSYARTWERVLFLYVWLVVTVVPFAGFRFGEYKRDNDMEFERSLCGHDALISWEMQQMEAAEAEAAAQEESSHGGDERGAWGVPDTAVSEASHSDSESAPELSDDEVLDVVICYGKLISLVFTTFIAAAYTHQTVSAPGLDASLAAGSLFTLAHLVVCGSVLLAFAMGLLDHIIVSRAYFLLPRRTLAYAFKRTLEAGRSLIA